MPMTPDEHERLARVDERLAVMQPTLTELVAELREYAQIQIRHDEQLKFQQRAGGSAFAFVLALVGALIKDRLHL